MTMSIWFEDSIQKMITPKGVCKKESYHGADAKINKKRFDEQLGGNGRVCQYYTLSSCAHM